MGEGEDEGIFEGEFSLGDTIGSNFLWAVIISVFTAAGWGVLWGITSIAKNTCGCGDLIRENSLAIRELIRTHQWNRRLEEKSGTDTNSRRITPNLDEIPNRLTPGRFNLTGERSHLEQGWPRREDRRDPGRDSPRRDRQAIIRGGEDGQAKKRPKGQSGG